MGFFSTIRDWVQRVKQAALLYALYRATPEQLKNANTDLKEILDELQENNLANFHRATGSVLTTWALMEERLVVIASLLLKIQPRKCGLIFYSIINFQVWITIITELFNLEKDFSDFQRRWNKIYERLRVEKDNRDRLAHNAVLSERLSENTLGKAIKKASRFDMRSKSQSFAPMTVEQVLGFGERIAKISDDLGTLTDDMMDRLERIASQGRSSEPSRDEPE